MSTWISATFMRGGTSKGVFFDERDLPGPGPERDHIFTSALGSPDPFGRQLDGMGGGISSLSKVVSVSASSRADADLEYTFGQVAVDEAAVDYSGNCGNLSSAVVPFALLAGIIKIDADGLARVVVYNTNTDKHIVVRLQVTDGLADTTGDFVLPGVAAPARPSSCSTSALAAPRPAPSCPPASRSTFLTWETAPLRRPWSTPPTRWSSSTRPTSA